MRALLLPLALLGAVPAVAQAVHRPAIPMPVPVTGPGAPAMTESEAQVDGLRQRLLASQQVIATLQRELADAKAKAAQFDECRVRNGRLVSISRQLIDGYARRYGQVKRGDPLQLGRRRYEFELQALSDELYDMNIDVPMKTSPVPALDAPAKGEGQK